MAFDPTDSRPSPTSPIEPVELRADSTFQFRCHSGIACFNACCRNIDITLAPYDILRLERHFGMTSKELVAEYTVPFEMDSHGMPGLNRFLNQVLFGEESIPIRQGARERRVTKRKALWAARRREAVARHCTKIENQQYGE